MEAVTPGVGAASAQETGMEAKPQEVVRAASHKETAMAVHRQEVEIIHTKAEEEAVVHKVGLLQGAGMIHPEGAAEVTGDPVPQITARHRGKVRPDRQDRRAPWKPRGWGGTARIAAGFKCTDISQFGEF